jgi:hypothetical protein
MSAPQFDCRGRRDWRHYAVIGACKAQIVPMSPLVRELRLKYSWALHRVVLVSSGVISMEEHSWHATL